MNDFSLIVNIPESAELTEIEMKELRTSFENMLNDYFSAFSEIAEAMHKKNPVFQCGTIAEFDNGKSFQILYTQRFDKNYVSVGMVDDYGMCSQYISYEDAVVVNKYVMELSMRIHKQRISVSKNILPEASSLSNIEYVLPSTKKMPIYKSLDNELNILDGPCKVHINRHK